MRAIFIMTLAALGACSATEEAENKAEPVAASIDAGFWEMNYEVTSMRVAGNRPAAVKAKEGDKASASLCVAEADRAKPAPALFAGEGYECSYRESYIKNGRLNATLTCARQGIAGDIMMSVDGTYTGTSMDATVNATSYLPGEGDFQMETKLAGRRVGECPAAADMPAKS